MKRIISILTLILLMAGIPLHAATSYQTLQQKAARFFGLGEWASASAMYSLMLDQKVDDPDVVGHAIVAAGMVGETDAQISLLTRALNAHLPIDSVLRATETASFDAGQTSLYEQFLFSVKEHEPWLSRVVDAYLLNYFTWRDNGPGIVRMSRVMLAGLPDSEQFLYSLAHGQLLCGDIAGAIATYRRIVKLNPKAYDALLYLGNYYIEADSTRSLGRDYLRRAQAIAPTPYVDQTLRGSE